MSELDRGTVFHPWRGLLRLRFPADLESEFLSTYRAASRRWIRVSMFVALSTVLGFAFIDHRVLTGPRVFEADIVRFGLQLPIVIVMLVFTTQRFYTRWYQPAVQIAAPLFGLGLIVMAMQASQAQLPLIAARLLLVTFFYYFMIGLTFHAAVRSNMTLVVGYGVIAAMGIVPTDIATYQLFVLLCANLIGAAGCYALEHANRVAFLERRRLADVAMHDGLTGLLNRTALDEQARRLWSQATRDKVPVSVVLIDIDHFKSFNDRYGHQAGDRCLRDVAAAIRRAARRRPLDLVARYGGEEFIAVLYGADRSHAETISRAVLEAVADMRIPHASSTTRPYITVSVGATTLESTKELTQELAVQLADRGLYIAKERGRDCWNYCAEGQSAQTEDLFPAEIFKTAS
jgi:diguanylate cyclase (GGDEF)-like protein